MYNLSKDLNQWKREHGKMRRRLQLSKWAATQYFTGSGESKWGRVGAGAGVCKEYCTEDVATIKVPGQSRHSAASEGSGENNAKHLETPTLTPTP